MNNNKKCYELIIADEIPEEENGIETFLTPHNRSLFALSAVYV
jgi:hypothetical protein